MGNQRSSPVSKITPVKDGDGGGKRGGRSSLRSESDNKKLSTKYGRLDGRAESWFNTRNEATLSRSIAFVPWIIQQSFFDGSLDNDDSVVTHRGEGAVIFSDASGFTALTERLALKSNGAELLCDCLTKFFTPLIDIIDAYRGDVIKFSGDALTIYLPAVDDTQHPRYKPAVPPHGTYGLPDLRPMATAVLRAAACCVEIHKQLHMFDTGVDGVFLCLHIGVGCGRVTILQVGGVVPPETNCARYEYVIAGEPMEQISIAEPLAKNGETCLSPQAWAFVKDCVVESPRKLEPQAMGDFHLLHQMDESKYTFPTVRNAAQLRDQRIESRFTLAELHVLRRYIPAAVFKNIEGGTLSYANEMRKISTIFISGSGVDVSTDAGSKIAQELMSAVQTCCYAHEGTLNKYLVDDKGMLFLLVFGLPPMVHTDDPARAVLACMDMVNVFRRLGLVGRFGVTSGRNYCGVVGSAKRMEYTVLGDKVNLAARLMANAQALSILVDEDTKDLSDRDVQYRALTPITVKGKTALIPIFEPMPRKTADVLGLRTTGVVAFPWRSVSSSLGGRSKLLDLSQWESFGKIQQCLEREGNRLSTPPTPPRTGSAVGDVSMSISLGGMRKRQFVSGGVLVISGENGMGKTELTEHAVTELVRQQRALPIFGTAGSRPGEKCRPVHELLRSIVMGFRHQRDDLPEKEHAALVELTSDGPPPHEHEDFVRGIAGEDGGLCAPDGAAGSEREAQYVSQGSEVVVKLLKRLIRERPVCCVLSLRSGSNIFPSKRSSEDEQVFWDVVQKMADMTGHKDSMNHALMVVLVIRGTLDDVPQGIRKMVTPDNFVRLSPLSDDGVLEYMSKHLSLPQDKLVGALHRFVATITRGNALFIRETIDQLIHYGHLNIVMDSLDQPQAVQYTKDLESINISEWSNTAMVGNTICLLESLDPLPGAVVKMSTVFQGVFTIADLAASSCPPWAGAHYIDAFRVFYAVTTLMKRNIIERAEEGDDKEFLGKNNPIDCFKLTSVLVRKVADAMLLEAQKKAIKRQALMERVLQKDLPPRMEELKRKKAIQHIPWYYQIDQQESKSKGS